MYQIFVNEKEYFISDQFIKNSLFLEVFILKWHEKSLYFDCNPIAIDMMFGSSIEIIPQIDIKNVIYDIIFLYDYLQIIHAQGIIQAIMEILNFIGHIAYDLINFGINATCLDSSIFIQNKRNALSSLITPIDDIIIMCHKEQLLSYAIKNYLNKNNIAFIFSIIDTLIGSIDKPIISLRHISLEGRFDDDYTYTSETIADIISFQNKVRIIDYIDMKGFIQYPYIYLLSKYISLSNEDIKMLLEDAQFAKEMKYTPTNYKYITTWIRPYIDRIFNILNNFISIIDIIILYEEKCSDTYIQLYLILISLFLSIVSNMLQ